MAAVAFLSGQVTFNIALNAMARPRLWQHALGLLRDMPKAVARALGIYEVSSFEVPATWTILGGIHHDLAS